jgi:hypothetical protein
VARVELDRPGEPGQRAARERPASAARPPDADAASCAASYAYASFCFGARPYAAMKSSRNCLLAGS